MKYLLIILILLPISAQADCWWEKDYYIDDGELHTELNLYCTIDENPELFDIVEPKLARSIKGEKVHYLNQKGENK